MTLASRIIEGIGWLPCVLTILEAEMLFTESTTLWRRCLAHIFLRPRLYLSLGLGLSARSVNPIEREFIRPRSGSRTIRFNCLDRDDKRMISIRPNTPGDQAFRVQHRARDPQPIWPCQRRDERPEPPLEVLPLFRRRDSVVGLVHLFDIVTEAPRRAMSQVLHTTCILPRSYRVDAHAIG
jgi:hypothetical protein